MAILEIEVKQARVVDSDTCGCGVLESDIRSTNWWNEEFHPGCARCPMHQSQNWEIKEFGGCSGLDKMGEGELKTPVGEWNRSRLAAAFCGIGKKING